ncbi:MAG: hypothetical protein VE98_C0001G0118 [candidate division Kazan bacterium GW2011_GWA1_50_15]|uniref:UPF0235 protein VF00_C0002G0236 n=2 Tax=Bacteria division Kazan-3B-28 TaxID=1798534 RepID=A0A0G1X7E5_UNCK3|nr:MAG: hypothetical protein VE98_C0001G0118 [candidate division Kazan bacterium GW2011_GWA1_50_15]KKW25606.1 MAG: hypothetical protein VE99_C0001G0243 [candidate division Kazan bacterium GW2011_GWC1_52_13]KKW26911.1 MAG: hypothetical protein VF00_C0002G0236 [candidate division Kazan bacterium GW2011_GWB1_52_7]HAV66099.1 hypothetical protein [Patescibacteria group bacterium]HCR42935.1 hypothetical protein [Patescibacteria group bacterium]
MRIKVVVVPRSSRNAIEELPDGSFKVWVRAVPEKGKANLAVIELLALNFRVPKTQIELISGHRDKHKIFEIFEA